MLRRTLLTVAGCAPLLPHPARAQGEWPQRAVTVLVPFVAGGPSDITARVIAQRLGQTLAQPVVAENRAGANGEVAARVVLRAPPDGHMLFVGSIGVFAINQALRPNLSYDALRDFTPITLAVTTPNVLVVNPERVPATDLAGVIAWMQANRGRVSYSTSGVGSSDHLTMELFKQLTDTEATHVPYGGGAAAATDLIAGNVQISFQNLGTVAGHVAGGRLRPIIVTSRERAAILPNVPTGIEQGLTAFDVTSWQAVMAPAGMAPALQARIGQACADALLHPESRARLEQIGFSIVASTPADYAAFQRAEVERWTRVIRTADIRPE